MNFLNYSFSDLFSLFLENLIPTNRGFNYFVNWKNIKGYEEYLPEIHALDVLIGCDDCLFRSRFDNLLSKFPSVLQLFPFLFGLSKKERKDLYGGKSDLCLIRGTFGGVDYLNYSFSSYKTTLSKKEINAYYDFFEQMGLKELYQSIIKKSTLDYIIGVLVGMDSNGRKNRGGSVFELACQPFIEDVAKKNKVELLVQKKFNVLRKFGFSISDDIASRRADFILVDRKKKQAINIEVNFYNSTGSKPEEIIDSYITRQSKLKENGLCFALVTDGECWKKARNQLLEGFRKINFLLNFYMLKHGMIEEILHSSLFDIDD